MVEHSSVHGTTHYLGGYERVDRTTADAATAKQYIEHRDSIATPEGIIGIITTRAPPTNAQGIIPTGTTLPAGTNENELNYWLKDHLGSVGVITDESGNITQRFRYDPWGKRQCASGPNANTPLTDDCLAQTHEERGFTGHETLDEVGLIHMNGRLYDPNTARFLHADPIIQDPQNSQSYNRYSYVLNNPLSFTDPSGFSWWTKWRKTIFSIIAAIVVTWLTAGLLTGMMAYGEIGTFAYGATTYAGAGLTTAGSAVSAMAGGFAAGGIQGGNLKSAVIGAVTAGVTFGIGEALGHVTAEFGKNAAQYAAKAAAHAAVGCASAAAAGGSCKAGAMAAGFSSMAGPYLPGGGTETFDATSMLGRMIAGGFASKLGGGKFENGAMTAAMEYLFNEVGNLIQRGYLTHTFKLNRQNKSSLTSITGDSYEAFSGSESSEFRNNPDATDAKNRGPLPEGDYYIVQRKSSRWERFINDPKVDWYELWRIDGNSDDSTYVNGVSRSGIRLHAGTISDGCLTVSVSSPQQWQIFRKSMTPSGLIPGTDRTYYGVLRVHQ
ncbi:MAG: hypothetical protein RLZZ502_846 [Pseudomonadota bacterium]